MTHGAEDLWRLLHQVDDIPYGPAQIAATEQLIRRVDAAGDAHLAFAARMLATSAYRLGGEPAKSFVTFSWCLGDFDRHPQPYHQQYAHELLWQHKWMVGGLLHFPEVPLDRAYSVLDDMERRYREGGHSLQAVYKYRHRVARHIGAVDEAEEWYRRWITTPRDQLSDCAGCDPSSQAHYLAGVGQDEAAIALAEPVLAGRLPCIEQPHGILTALLLPYLRTGRRESARDAHRRAYRAVRGNLADLWDIGEHVEFCALTGNDARGLEIVERHLDWLDRAPSPAAAMDFAAAAALVLRRLVAAGYDELAVHRPAYGDRPAAEVPAGELAVELSTLATKIALQFDARNGTTAQSESVARRLSAEPIGEHLPLSATTRRRLTPGVGGADERSSGESPGEAGRGPVLRLEKLPQPPADASPEELLDLAEEYARTDWQAALFSILRIFDERFGSADLVPTVAGRRADLRGNERYLQNDAEGAEAAWRSAIALFEQAGDQRRAAISAGRLGVLLCVTGKSEQGLPMVEKTTEVLTSGEVGDRADGLGRLATALVASGRPVEALSLQDQAIEAAEAAGEPHRSARFLLRRTQILEMLDQRDELRASAARARESYRELSAEGYAAASLLWARSLDDPAEVLQAYDEAVHAAGTGEVAVDARLGRARALVVAERFGEAIDDFVEVVAHCVELGIAEGATFTRFELAHTYYRAGRVLEAAEAGEEALVGLTKLGAVSDADGCRHLLANIYADLGEIEAAVELLDQLAGNLDGPDNLPGRAQVREEAGELLYRMDRDALAAQRFAAAAQAYGLAGLHLDQLRASRRQAAALHWAGSADEAMTALRWADELSAALPVESVDAPATVWERAMLDFEGARVLIGADRLDDALVRVAGVPKQLRSIEAFGEALHAELLLGEVLLRLDRPDQAEPILRGALSALPRDSGATKQAAWLLAQALTGLGRSAEAEELWAEHDLEADE